MYMYTHMCTCVCIYRYYVYMCTCIYEITYAYINGIVWPSGSTSSRSTRRSQGSSAA